MRSSTLPTTKQDRHPTCKRNPLHHEDSLSNTAIQYLLHQSTVQDVIHKQKQQSPSQTTVSSKPTPTNNIKEQYPTETETKMDN